MGKKLIVTLLTALLIVSMVSTGAFAANMDFHDTKNGDVYKYNEFMADDDAFNALVDLLIDRGEDFLYEYEGLGYNYVELLKNVTENGDDLEAGLEATEAVELPGEQSLAVESISAVNATQIRVVFNKTIEEFAVENISATGLTFSNPVIAEDGLSVVLIVAGAEFEGSYQVTVKGIVEEDYTETVTFGTVNDYYDLQFTFDAEDTNENGIVDIEATGATTVQVTAQVIDLTGNPVNAEGVIRFTTTRGGIAQPEKTLQAGKASIQLTSESSLTNAVYANISAQIVGDYYLEGLTDKTIVEFLPPGGVSDPSAAVPVVKVESNQADRFFVTLGQEKPGLSAEDLDAIANAIKVTDGIKGDNPAVKSVRQVNGKVLEVLLDVEASEANYLTDNARHTFDFDAVPEILLPTLGQQFKLTDTTKQFVLSVNAVDQRTLEVKFSEAVAWDTDADAKSWDANNPANYVINGEPLTATTITDFELSPDRKTVTINLASDDSLTASDDNLEVKNIGDWAGVVDAENRISTQRIEYPVNIDESIPTVEITRQSPEQFLFEIDKEVISSADLHEVISVYYGEDGDDDGLRDDQYDIDLDPSNGTDGITFTAMNDGVQVADATTGYFNQILVELEADWTKEDGTGNPMAAHWVDANPFQFIIPEDTFITLIGNENLEVNEEVVNGRDRVSPVAVDFTQDKDADANWLETAVVEMSEPVQINGLTQPSVTPNAEQEKQNGVGFVQAAEINFEKDGVVVSGEIDSVSLDDFTFVIQANDGVDTGFAALRAALADAEGTWTVSITGISDDYGNTMATQEFDFEVPALPGGADPMEVSPEVMYAEYDSDSDYEGTGSEYDVIRVKFTEVMSNSGAKAVGDTTNYVLNGKTLADLGSSIRKGIEGVTSDWDGITILLPEDTLGVDANFVLTVASNLESKDGQRLVGENELDFVDTDLNNSDTLTSYYSAEILVDDYDFAIVKGNVKDLDSSEELTEAGDIITIEFEEAPSLADIEQVTVNGKVITTALDVTGNTLTIDMEGADISYDTGDRIEVKVNGQTVYVKVK